MTTKVATFPLRLPVSMKAALEKIAERDGTSMNQFLVIAAAEKFLRWRQNDSLKSVAGALIARPFGAFSIAKAANRHVLKTCWNSTLTCRLTSLTPPTPLPPAAFHHSPIPPREWYHSASSQKLRRMA